MRSHPGYSEYKYDQYKASPMSMSMSNATIQSDNDEFILDLRVDSKLRKDSSKYPQ